MYEDIYGIPDEPDDGPRAEAPGRAAARGAFWGCLASVVILTLLLVLWFAFGSGDFVAFGVSSDITEFLELVRESDLDVETAQPLLDRLDALRESARRGEHVGFWIWLDYDESIRALIEDGDVTREDLESLARELDSVEGRLRRRTARPPDAVDPAKPSDDEGREAE